jgi:hypothetical protein
MASNLKDAILEVANSNTYFFQDSRLDDFIIRTTDPTQRVLIGTASNQLARLNIGSNASYATGNFGFGVSNPAYTIDVGGDINFNGILRQGGNPYVSSQWSNLPSSNIAYTLGGVSVNTTSVNAPLTVGGGVCILRSGINTVGGSNAPATPASTGISVNALQLFDTSNWLVAPNNQSLTFTIGNGVKHLSIASQCYASSANILSRLWYHIHNASNSNVVHTGSNMFYFNQAAVHASQMLTRILTSNVLPAGTYFMRLGLSNAIADTADGLTATLIDYS